MRAEDQPKADDTSVPASGSEPNLSVPASDSGTPKNASFSGSGDSLTPSPAGPDGTPATQMHEPVTPPTDEASLPSSGTPVSPVPLDLSQETVKNAQALHLSPKVCKKVPLNSNVINKAKELKVDANGICEDMLKAEEQCKAVKANPRKFEKFKQVCSKLWKSITTPSSSVIANPNTHDLFGVDQ